MIADILTYIGSYDDVRTACGLSEQELSDSSLALVTYRHSLGLKLADVSGIYGDASEDQTLQEIFDDDLATDDPMYAAIQLYSIYCTAATVLTTVGLRGYKTITDGKSSLTRFSAEATFQDVQKAVYQNITTLLGTIADLLEDSEEAISYLSVVSPDVDLVLGEE